MKETFIQTILTINYHHQQEDRVRMTNIKGPESEYLKEIRVFAETVPVPVVTLNCREPAVYLTPYQPFLYFLYGQFRQTGMDIDEILREAGVYPLHRQIFRNYFSDQIPGRTENPVYEEVRYESDCFKKDLAGLLKTILLKTPAIISLVNCHLLSQESLEFLKLISASLESRTMILVHFDFDSFNKTGDIPDYIIDHFNEMIVGESYIDLNSSARSRSRRPAKLPAGDIIDSIRNSYYFFSLNQGLELIRLIESDYLSSLNRESMIRFYLYAGKILYFMEEMDDAISCLHELLSLTSDHTLLAETHVILSDIYLVRNDLDESAKHSQNARFLLNPDKENLLYARVLMSIHLYNQKTGKPTVNEDYLFILKSFEKYGWKNNLIYLLLNYNAVNVIGDDSKTTELFYEKALGLAEEISNDLALSAVYHRKGILSYHTSGKKTSMEFYRRGIELRKKIGQKLPLVRVQNGVCYFLTNCGEYEAAFQYITDNIRMIIDINDSSEIIISFYNLAILYFFSRQYRESLKVIQKILKILQAYEISSFPFHNLTDIHLFGILARLKLGEDIRALGLFQYIENNIQTLNRHYLPLYYLYKALVADLERDPEGAGRYFKSAFENIPADKAAYQKMFPLLCMEQAIMLYRQGDREGGDRMVSQGSVIAQSEELKAYQEWFQQDLKKPDTIRPVDLPAIEINLNLILSQARLQKSINKVHKKMNDLRFLQHSMDIFNSSMNMKEFTENLIRFINNHFYCDFIELTGYQNNLPGIIERFNGSGIPDFQPSDYQWIKQQKKGKKISRKSYSGVFPAALNGIEELLIYPLVCDGETSGFLITGYEKSSGITQDDADVLGILANHTAVKLISIQQNQELQKYALHDSLTQLANRKALDRQIQYESKRLKRYQNKPKSNQFTVCFIDLDNFKYYNDAFGHIIGDYIISWFSQILRKIFRETDFICRYGGDEFVILLPETATDEAVIAVNRIYDMIRQENYFVDPIRNILNHQIEIPDEYRLSCSIGIASLSGTVRPDHDLELLISRADESLYQAKRNGKGRIVVYRYPDS